ncbi:unnamed protein product [Rotaria magnacalcarata]|uniref:Ig-like domain-containing protein n=1 Tax=Rotaria magnacalcarata TaxID=392030 RepID=A0A816SG81_9BILA|nr:unnamed protein product [Rotaria magnacalcarata]CAF3845009.1 unnamed protein product [Rotaria magnacalcarata]
MDSYYFGSSSIYSSFSRVMFGGSSRHHNFETPYAYRALYRQRLFQRPHSVGPSSLPETPRLEHRDVSYARRPAHEAEVSLWHEPDTKPVFSFMLRPRLIQEGIGCKLICCINGKPQPKVQWFKDRTQLSDNDTHYLTSYVHGVCTLEITACETSDTGMFRCSATNPLGSDETSCLLHVEEQRRTRRAHSARPGDEDTSRGASRAHSPSPIRASGKDASWRDKLAAGAKPARDTLDVEKPKRKERRDPPKFSDQLSDVTVFEGSTAKFRCEVKGKPTPKIEWLKNGESLVVESRIQQLYDEDVATLVIKKIKLDDNGEYICRATNDEGSDISSAQLTVKAHIPGENEEDYAATLAQEDEVVVQAEPQAASEEAAPAVAVESTEGAVSETSAKVEEQLPSETVAATESAPAEAPASIEAASAPAAEPAPAPAAEPAPAPAAEPTPAPAPVPEPVKPAAGKAAASKKPATPAAPEKKPVGAAALKKPEPAKKVEEKKEPAGKKPADNKTKKPAADEKKKEEAEPKKNDEAEPKKKEEEEPKKNDEAEPKKKEEEEEVQEKPAEVKPKFVKHIKSQNLMEGDPLTLDCVVLGGNEAVELTWLRNSKEIPENPDFRREREGNSFKLVVAEVFPEDSGVFSALLKSEIIPNPRFSSCSVIIQARDEEPLDPCVGQFPQSISTEEGHKAKFSCTLSGTTPMTAEWSVNGKQLDRQSSRFVFTDSEKEFSFEIPVVLATDEGQYHVTVANDKGEITAAFSLHVDQS